MVVSSVTRGQECLALQHRSQVLPERIEQHRLLGETPVNARQPVFEAVELLERGRSLGDVPADAEEVFGSLIE